MVPHTPVDIATGIIVTWLTSAFTGEIVNVGLPQATRGSVDTSHQLTTVARTFDPTDLQDNGEATFDLHFNPDTVPPFLAKEVLRIEFPLTAGSTKAKWEFSQFTTAHGPSANLEEKMVVTLTVKVDGVITITPEA